MKKKNNLLKPAIALLILILVLFFLTKAFSQKKPSTYQQSAENSSNIILTNARVYQSKNLKFKITAPAGYQLEERFTTVTLENKDERIIISKIATNFENIEDYLTDLSRLNKIKIINQQKLIIDQLNTIKGEIDYSDNFNPSKLSYFIYVDEGWVYTLSTSSPVLFADLDKIALSFEYTP